MCFINEFIFFCTTIGVVVVSIKKKRIFFSRFLCFEWTSLPEKLKEKKSGSKALKMNYYSRMSEKSSTKMMWPIKWGGERSSTECTVLRSTDHASLWKHIMTSVGGRSSKYRSVSLHLSNDKNGGTCVFVCVMRNVKCQFDTSRYIGNSNETIVRCRAVTPTILPYFVILFMLFC